MFKAILQKLFSFNIFHRFFYWYCSQIVFDDVIMLFFHVLCTEMQYLELEVLCGRVYVLIFLLCIFTSKILETVAFKYTVGSSNIT